MISSSVVHDNCTSQGFKHVTALVEAERWGSKLTTDLLRPHNATAPRLLGKMVVVVVGVLLISEFQREREKSRERERERERNEK
jgi:hypothetical protein